MLKPYFSAKTDHIIIHRPHFMRFQKSPCELRPIRSSKTDCSTGWVFFVGFVWKLRNALRHFTFTCFFFLSLNFSLFKLPDSLFFELPLFDSVLSLHFFILHLLHFSLTRNWIKFSLISLLHVHIVKIWKFTIVDFRHSERSCCSVLNIWKISFCMGNHINDFHNVDAFVACSSC